MTSFAQPVNIERSNRILATSDATPPKKEIDVAKILAKAKVSNY